MSLFRAFFLYYFCFQDVFPDKATERKILSFAIKCPSEGCDWTEELRSKEVTLYNRLSPYPRLRNKSED